MKTSIDFKDGDIEKPFEPGTAIGAGQTTTADESFYKRPMRWHYQYAIH